MSTGGCQVAGHRAPSASCSPGPLRGLEPGPREDRACGGHVPEVWAAVCKGRLGAQLALHRVLAGGVDAALQSRWSRQTQAGPCGPLSFPLSFLPRGEWGRGGGVAAGRGQPGRAEPEGRVGISRAAVAGPSARCGPALRPCTGAAQRWWGVGSSRSGAAQPAGLRGQREFRAPGKRL